MVCANNTFATIEILVEFFNSEDCRSAGVSVQEVNPRGVSVLSSIRYESTAPTQYEEASVVITYNIYIVIRETGQFSSKGIINDFIGNLNRLTVSRRFTEQAV